MRQTRETQDHYEVLALSPSASDAEIKASYRRLVRQYHPDCYRTFSRKAWATRKLQSINAAYEVLRDPAKRRAYDRAKANTAAAISSQIAPGSNQRVRFRKWWKAWYGTPLDAVFKIGWVLASLMFAWWTTLQDSEFRGLPTIVGFCIAGVSFYVAGGFLVISLLSPLLVVGVAFLSARDRAAENPSGLKRTLVGHCIALSVVAMLVAVTVVRVELIWKPAAIILVLGAPFYIPFLFFEAIAIVYYLIRARYVVARAEGLVILATDAAAGG